MNYYETLGVSKTASADDIKSAFREKALKYHPDKNDGDKKAEDMFKNINNAYSVLSDPNKRRMYDMGADPNQPNVSGGFGGFGGFGPGGDIFEEVFSRFNAGFGGGGRQRRPSQQVINIIIKINLYESIFGAVKGVKFNYRPPCAACSGSGAKEFRTCEACGGSGMRTVQQGPNSQIMTPCSSCAGTGKVIKERCDVCGGSGKGDVKERNVEVNILPNTLSGEKIIVQGGGVPDNLGNFGPLVVNIEVIHPDASSFSDEDKKIIQKLLDKNT